MKYPIKIDSDKPTALYFDSLGLPKVDADFKNKDSYIIQASSREYLFFTIAAKILEKSMEYDRTILNSRLSRLIKIINKNKNSGYSEIETADQLLKEIKTSRDFYYENYIKYVKGQIEKVARDNVSIPFLQLEMFVMLYKEAMKINSYFGIIFDKKSALATSSTLAINDLIGSRINKDISMKIAIEPDNWERYIGTNGQFVEATHDYGIVELDDSFKKNMKTLTKHF